jgi:hypothetical protein
VAQYVHTLRDLIGSVRQVKPNCPPTRIRDIINLVLRDVIDFRPLWSGLLKNGVIAIPAPYSTGTITLTEGSAVATGSGTSWPVTDQVNTTIPNAITEPGSRWVTPSAMTGITEDVLLRVDVGASEEFVSVLETNATQFRAVFAKPHDDSCALVTSSYVGRQLVLSATYPVYTIKAVRSATELELDLPWVGTTLTGTSYSIKKMYYTFAHDMKDLLWVVDPTQPRELDLHYPLEQLQQSDPQRTQSGDPYLISDVRATESGNMQYEIYPLPAGSRQLPFMYVRQWPELRKEADRLPPFLNPNVILYGAYSMALMTKQEDKDTFYDPVVALEYKRKYMEALQFAANADDGKCQQTLTHEKSRWGVSMGANWAQSHDVSASDGNAWW